MQRRDRAARPEPLRTIRPDARIVSRITGSTSSSQCPFDGRAGRSGMGLACRDRRGSAQVRDGHGASHREGDLAEDASRPEAGPTGTDTGKDSPMPFVLNLIYLALLLACSPGPDRCRPGAPGSIARGSPRRCGARPPDASATTPASGSTPSASARSCSSAPWSPTWPDAGRAGMSSSRPPRRTGLAVARRTFPDLVTFYAPLDFSWSARRAIARVRPTVLALVELELWPNLIRDGQACRLGGGDHQRPSQRAEPPGLSAAPRARSARPSGGSTPWRRRARSMPIVSSTSASPGVG